MLSGAGISTDSGIPDFRGPDGIWTKNPDAEKMATLQCYVSDPEVRKKAWLFRMEPGIWDAEPNAGHHALVALEERGTLLAIVTQNVDGLHQKAGISPEKMIEIHGTMAEYVCLGCDRGGPMEETLERVRAGEEDPSCLHCGGMLKSATIAFGQNLVAEDLFRMEDVSRNCDLLLAVGSTLTVFPAANAVPIAADSGARIVIVNGSPTEMDSLADCVLNGSISEILSKLTT